MAHGLQTCSWPIDSGGANGVRQNPSGNPKLAAVRLRIAGGRSMRHPHARCFARGILGFALAALGSILVPMAARAGVDADVRAGVYTDADAVSVGGGVLTQVGNSNHWYFNPNVELAMGNRKDIV